MFSFIVFCSETLTNGVDLSWKGEVHIQLPRMGHPVIWLTKRRKRGTQERRRQGQVVVCFFRLRK